LVTVRRDAGRLDSALEYARQLIQLEPEDPRNLNLLNQLIALQKK